MAWSNDMATSGRLLLAGVMAVSLAVTGCNTFKGMGKDIQSAGQALERASEKTRDAISK